MGKKAAVGAFLVLLCTPVWAQGIAQSYPGDVGIENDPNVILVEMFEEANISTVFSRWWVTGGPAMTLVNDAPSGSSGTRSLEISGPAGGGSLYKSLSPGIDDRAYVRCYLKYVSSGGYHHAGPWMGGFNPPTPWPQGTSGRVPNGSDFFEALAERSSLSPTLVSGGYWTNGAGSFIQNTPPAMPMGQWLCLEVMVKLNNPVSSSNGELAVWLDGTMVLELKPGSPNGFWNGGNFVVDPAGAPFGGFQWRTDSALNFNFVNLLNYVTANPAGTVRYDHGVIAKSYIGPISTGGPVTLPAAPTNLAATAVAPSQINLSWTDNSTNETGFKIERKTGAAGTYAQIAAVGGNVTSFNNTGLAAGTTYFYRVRATNAAGDSAYSNEASAATPSTLTDTDGDGLPDSWEMFYFMNLNQGANGDPDGDGATNLQEYLAGTDPTVAAPAPGGGGGGGHHGGCGATGLETLLVLGFIRVARRRLSRLVG